MRTLKFLSIILLFAFFVISCRRTKEGPPGRPGNANVVSGTITTADWVYYNPSWELTINYNMITRDIIEYGAVLVYMQSGSSYRQLPLTIFNEISTDTGPYYYSTLIDVDTFVGGVAVYWTDSDFFEPENPGRRTFKIVVIAASEYGAHDIDYSDYSQVKETFNLAD